MNRKRILFGWLACVALLASAPLLAAPKPKDVVYLSQTGTKYHKKDCRTLEKEPTESTREKAEKMGRKACKLCKP